MEQHTTTIDLRGSDASSAGVGLGVLADPTGRRGRTLRRVGRAVAVLFGVWLAALALAGLGLLPSSGVPLASRAGIDAAPPPLSERDPLVAPKGARAAVPSPAATTAPAPARRPPTASERPVASPRRTAAPLGARAPARRRPTAVARPVHTPAPGRPAIPPGRSIAPPGRPATPPGQTRRAAAPRTRPPQARSAPTLQARPAPRPATTIDRYRGSSGSAPGRLTR